MKIKMDAAKKVTHADLLNGIVFMFEDEVYMKVETTRSNKEYNAVFLSSGRLTSFNTDEEVLAMLSSELVVK